uniref:(northern house mosquito) hypothetical protein n=1 Tax=Culex pipiens TaxID=7175 RepID=A0A8D8B785_CULPI
MVDRRRKRNGQRVRLHLQPRVLDPLKLLNRNSHLLITDSRLHRPSYLKRINPFSHVILPFNIQRSIHKARLIFPPCRLLTAYNLKRINRWLIRCLQIKSRIDEATLLKVVVYLLPLRRRLPNHLERILPGSISQISDRLHLHARLRKYVAILLVVTPSIPEARILKRTPVHRPVVDRRRRRNVERLVRKERRRQKRVRVRVAATLLARSLHRRQLELIVVHDRSHLGAA